MDQGSLLLLLAGAVAVLLLALVVVVRRRRAPAVGAAVPERATLTPAPADRLRQGLLATRRKLGERLEAVLGRTGAPTEDVLAEIEEALVAADVGVRTAGGVVARVRTRVAGD